MGRCIAISIRQPWASLIVLGHKTVENRTKNTRHRGTILIHASLKIDRAGFDLVRERLGIVLQPDGMPRGGIIGRVDIVGVVTASTDPWFTGPYGWILERGRPLPFVPCRGHAGWFYISHDRAGGDLDDPAT